MTPTLHLEGMTPQQRAKFERMLHPLDDVRPGETEEKGEA